MIVDAGDERIAALDPMHEILLSQEIECSINGDGGRPRALPCQTINEIISPKWMMACQKSFEDPSAYGSQALLACGANRFSMKMVLLGTTGYHPSATRHTACFMASNIETDISAPSFVLERAIRASRMAS